MGDTGVSNSWYITAAESYLDVWGYLRPKSGSFRNPSSQDLERAPFTVYTYEQKLGDLVVIPPRR